MSAKTPVTRGMVCGGCGYWAGGQCRRFPPQMVPSPNDNQHPISYWPAEWFPARKATDWACGEWEP